MMFDLWQRLQREVKVNGKKAGLLAGLFVFGCCFWIPMLTRAVVPKRASAAVTPSAHTQFAPPAPVNSLGVPPASAEDSNRYWSDLTRSLAEDPMFQSADLQSISRDPFHVEEGPEPLPVLLAEEPKPKLEIKSDKPERQLQLSSTIIGRTRRAALINGQMYSLGRQIQANGRNYQLTKIDAHQVVLSSDEQTLVLTIARPQLKDVLERGDPAAVPPQ